MPVVAYGDRVVGYTDKSVLIRGVVVKPMRGERTAPVGRWSCRLVTADGARKWVVAIAGSW